MSKGIIVTNIPAVYRIDFYDHIGGKGFKLLFYDFDSKQLDYCKYKGKLDFPWEKVNCCTLFIKLIRENPEAVCCINANHITLICALYSFLFGKKFIIWWAGTPLSERSIPLYRRLFRRLVFSLADIFLAYSEHAAQYLHDFSVPKNKVEIIGNVTFDPKKYHDLVKKRKDEIKKNEYIRIISAANLIKRKNHEFLIDVFSEIKDRHKNVKLLIAGDGPEKETLIKKVKEKGIKDVEFLGMVRNEDMYKIYEIGDLFVHTAAMDQWSQVVNEAIATGLPVVVSRTSGISEQLFENGKELIILEGEKNDFADVIDKLITNYELRKDTGEKGLKKLINIWQNTLVYFDSLIEKAD